MEEQKVSAVRSWPVPSNIKAVQHFLGFSNYFRRFIRGFSTAVAPFTSLLKRGPRQLSWTGEANKAFHVLKERFTKAPVLAHPDPSLPFIPEVDVSELGEGAVLSPWIAT